VQGARAEYLHVVVEGSVELYADWQGRSTTMAVVQPVGHLHPGRLRARPAVSDVCPDAGRPRACCLVPATDLRAIFRRDPEFAVSIVGELAGAFRSMARHAKNLKLRTSRERVAGYLLKQSELADGADRFVLQIEKRLVASYLGMTPENLSRALKGLES
jgi:CRP/FNR family transcriptional regulator, transcriptional activator FtrB